MHARKIELTQFAIVNPGDIRAAYELGVTDGEAFAAPLGQCRTIFIKLSKPCFGRGCRKHLF